jgi:uncharacterized repeat protein (TIGR03803 family)
MKNLLNITCRFVPVWFVLLALVAMSPQNTNAQIAFDREHAFQGGASDGASPEYGSTLTAAGPTLFGVTTLGGASNSGTLFMTGTNLASLHVLHSFNGYSELNTAGSTNDGAYPYGTPLLAGQMMYGTTSYGGTNGLGILYAINTNGNGFTILHHFGAIGDGYAPFGSLILTGSTLYGMTSSGTNGITEGTIYSIGTDGSNYQILNTFGPGGDPKGSLLLSGTNLYGMTYDGGSNSSGNIFVICTNGSGYMDLHSFTGEVNDGAFPSGSVIMSGGVLYGMTASGGSNNVGIVFSMNTDGSGFTILHNFSMSEAWAPVSDLTISGSTLYGMAQNGGINSVLGGGYGSGAVFQINTDGTGYRILHSFEFPGPETDGSLPYGPLLLLGNELYGMTSLGGSAADKGVIFGINSTALPIITTPNPLPVGAINMAYNEQLTATGGTAPYIWAIASGSLPAGLKLSSSGLISGKPTGVGMADFSIKVTDHVGTSATQALSLSIVPSDSALAVAITYPTAGQEFSNPPYIAIAGTATGKVDLAYVRIKLNSGPWLNTTSSNGDTNWEFPLIVITPGTNTVSAFAVDDYGNISKTNSVTFVDVVTAELTVLTNGPGSISQSLNGRELLEGATYSMTASAPKGISFINWTDGSNNIVTNGTTVRFVMVTNLVLVANFVDTTPPALTITAPKLNEKWSNSIFTVTGTAKDNVAVSNVLVSANDGGWTAATLSNGGSNWSANVTLTPGTNTIAAYALGTSDLLSTTNTVKMIYILSATLTVQTNGDGTVTPNDNNALLQIGASYSMKATAAKGFGFVNWTDGGGNVLTNGVTLDFSMASNLTFVANFKDITPPTLTITAPKANEKWSNADFTVTGTAKDNVAISNVFYSLNNGGWIAATLSNRGSNWSAGVTLTPGTNTIAAYAVGTGDLLSTTDTVKVIYILSAPLTVLTNGDGTVSPDYNGDLLEIGASYTMKATAAKGFAFYYWSGGVPMTNDPTLNFIMASNLTIIANFKDVTPPVATITFPTANQKWSNSVITVTGTASDNVGVTSVEVQINDGGWTEAETLNAFTNWNATNLAVIFGTNIVQAYAMDGADNLSTTDTVKFIANFPISSNPPAGMAYIPAGEFMMGDTLDGEYDARPTNVTVSAFYMDTNLVSYSQWQTVYNLATNNGYRFDDAGSAQATNQPVQPVQTVNWYDVVKWCNARSQQTGLTPVYYTDAGLTHVYTNGDVTNATVNWSANGYRLPTEAEWEKAARGGLSEQRFPWGDTISESRANYYSYWVNGVPYYSYDVNTYSGYNTNFETGVYPAGVPYTSPVGYFAANGYGLYDMAGNLYEWCWDWYAPPPYPAGSPYLGGTNPTGPPPSTWGRVMRGGFWADYAVYASCGSRYPSLPAGAYDFIGFRCVRGH